MGITPEVPPQPQSTLEAFLIESRRLRHECRSLQTEMELRAHQLKWTRRLFRNTMCQYYRRYCDATEEGPE